jgi:hypothetical protein
MVSLCHGFLHWLGLGPVASSLLAIGLHGAYTFRCIFVNTKMIKLTKRDRPRGRPTKRPQDRPFQMRVSEQFLRTVDDWRRCQIDLPSRAEAIRRLVELATKIKKKPDADH